MKWLGFSLVVAGLPAISLAFAMQTMPIERAYLSQMNKAQISRPRDPALREQFQKRSYI